MSYNCVSGYYHVFYLLEMYSIGLLFLPALACRRAGTSCGSVSVSLSVCVCVCLSVTRRSSIETAEGIELAFGIEASFDLSYTVF